MGRDRLQPEVAYKNVCFEVEYVSRISSEEKHLHCEHFIWNSCIVE